VVTSDFVGRSGKYLIQFPYYQQYSECRGAAAISSDM